MVDLVGFHFAILRKVSIALRQDYNRRFVRFFSVHLKMITTWNMQLALE